MLWLRKLLWRTNDRELDEEMATHVEMAAADYRRAGYSDEEANRRAMADFGGVQQARELHLDARGFAAARALGQDAKYAIRSLRRDLGFTVTAFLVLAAGIGANTAMFSIVDSVLLRPLNYKDPDRLVSINERIPQWERLAPALPVNSRHFLEWKRESRTLEDAALVDENEWNLTGVGEPERVNGAAVTTNFFEVLGVHAQSGRTFRAQDKRERAAVISHSLWQRRFGAAPGVVGRSLSLNGAEHTVVGVLPQDFQDYVARKAEVYTAWNVEEDLPGWAGDHNYNSVGRLRAGVTREQAVAELNVIQARITQRFEDTGKLDLLILLAPLQENLVGGTRTSLLTLLGAVATVLLIACLNLGNLMLARSMARMRETAVRAALGASSARIVRGTVLEAMLLSVGSAGAGLAIAAGLVSVFRTASSGVPRAAEASLDWRAGCFAAALAIVTAAVSGAAPAWRFRRANPQDALRTGGRAMTDGRTSIRFREGLAMAEVALSVALTIVAGLLVASSLRLDGVDRGYNADNVLTAEVSLPETRYGKPELRRAFFSRVLADLQQQPGVQATGVVSRLPLGGERWSDVVTKEGETRPIAERPILQYRPVTPDYFRAIGIPLLAGRTVAESDYPRRTALLSRRAAERIWPGLDPIGRKFRRGNPNEAPFEVVGIVGDVRNAALDRDFQPVVYVALWARVPSSASLVVRTVGDPATAAAGLRAAVHAADPEAPIADMQTMRDIERKSTARSRFVTALVTGFGAAALAIALLGAYSVLAWSTGRRRSEIGVRLALGAAGRDVVLMVVRQGLRPVVLGVLAGIALAAGSARVVSSLFFQPGGPADMGVYAGVAALTITAGLAACFAPAIRSARIAPSDALRAE